MTEPIHIIAIGDPFLDAATLCEVITPRLPSGAVLEALDWNVGGKEPLQRINLQCEQRGPDAIDPPAELLAAIPRADILFTQFCPVSARALEAAPRLRVIGVGRSGVENIDVMAATRRGVCVLNTVGRNAEAVAEYAIGLLLCEARNIARGHAALKRGEWRKKYPNDESVPELPGRTLGLVGLGAIGRLLVKRLSGFDMKFLAYDPYADAGAATALGVALTDLPTLMRASDFISIHAKLTPETRGLISRELIALMKPTAYLINTARAELVDEAALAESLRSGRIAGAALDVFMREPLPASDPLAALDNVTLSPHQGGVSVDAYRTTARMFIDNVRRLWDGGELPANLVNRETQSNLQNFKDQIQRRAL